eukprot:gene4759-4930_t
MILLGASVAVVSPCGSSLRRPHHRVRSTCLRPCHPKHHMTRTPPSASLLLAGAVLGGCLSSSAVAAPKYILVRPPPPPPTHTPVTPAGPANLTQTIIIDDLGWYDTQVHNPDSPTPNIGQLADAGVRLDHHYVFNPTASHSFQPYPTTTSPPPSSPACCTPT